MRLHHYDFLYYEEKIMLTICHLIKKNVHIRPLNLNGLHVLGRVNTVSATQQKAGLTGERGERQHEELRGTKIMRCNFEELGLSE